jgi:hypothetical protein
MVVCRLCGAVSVGAGHLLTGAPPPPSHSLFCFLLCAFCSPRKHVTLSSTVDLEGTANHALCCSGEASSGGVWTAEAAAAAPIEEKAEPGGTCMLLCRAQFTAASVPIRKRVPL